MVFLSPKSSSVSLLETFWWNNLSCIKHAEKNLMMKAWQKTEWLKLHDDQLYSWWWGGVLKSIMHQAALAVPP